MRSMKTFLVPLLCLVITRCATTAPVSHAPKAEPDWIGKADEASSFYAEAPASAPATLPSSAPEVAPAGRYEGKLWTLCNPVQPEGGFCLSLAQAREIRIRFYEELADREVEAIDADERAAKAEARERAAEAETTRSKIIGAALGTLFSLIAVGAGIAIGHFAW